MKEGLLLSFNDILIRIQSSVVYLKAYELIRITLLAVFLFTCATMVRKFLRRAGDRFKDARDSFLNLLGDIIYYITLFAIVMLYFRFFGIDIKTIIAGMGLTGFVLGMALKDILSNLLSGVVILASRPFNPGDIINIGGKEGELVEINLRHVILRKDNDIHLIPASTVFSSTIIVKDRYREEEN